MDNQFKQNALSWGDDGAKWINRLPDMILEYEKKWEFKARKPFELNYNYVAPVDLLDGTKAVLKIGYPKNREFQSEITALNTFNSTGICRLLKADHENAVILIEQVIPGTVSGTIEDDDEATRILASVMKKLRKPLPDNNSYISITEWASVIPEYKAKHADDSLLPIHLLDKAEMLFNHLIQTSEEPVLLHGDLHHYNVLFSDERGWIAIDPKGVAAEPAYEVTAMIRNPYDKIEEIADLQPLLKRRIDILSEELKFDKTRIRDWCFAQCIISAIWSVEGVKGPNHALRVAKALDNLVI
jgi:streptomycin 6-kinase